MKHHILGRFPAFLHLLTSPSSDISYTGVSDIQTNVEAKSVVVVHDESVASADLLAKLQKWSAASGKSVALSS